MWNDFLLSFRIRSTYQVNSIIFSLKQLPFVKKFLPSSLYANEGLKTFGNIVRIIMEFFSIFFGKFLSILLLVFLYLSILGKGQGAIFLHVFVFLTFIGAFLNTQMFNPSKDKYYAIVLMRMKARNYALSNYFYFLLKMVVGYLPFTILFGVMCQVPWWITILLPFFVAFTKLIYTAYSLKRFEKQEKIVNENLPSRFVWSMAGILLVVAYGLPFLNIYLTVPLFLVLFVVVFGLGLYSFSIIYHFSDYDRIYKSLLNPDHMYFDMKRASTQAVRESSLGQITDDKTVTSSKTGYAYFNDLFVKRHRKILTDSMKKVTIVALGILFLLVIVVLVSPEACKNVNQFLLLYLPYFLFIMYLINRGGVVTQAMFMNCDHSMLSYRFYRQPRVILHLFRERLRTLILINLPPTLVIAFGLPLLLLVSGGTSNPWNYLLLMVTIVAMSIFFSVHHLVLYYLLQPYNEGLEMKSMTYGIVNYVTYFACFYATKVTLSTTVFGTLMTLFCILYVGIALWGSYRYAPQTFHLRK